MNPLQRLVMSRITGSKGDPNLDDLLERSDAVLAAVAPAPVAPATDSRRRHTFAGGNPTEHMTVRQLLRYMPKAASEVGSFLKSMRMARGYRPLPRRAVEPDTAGRVSDELQRLGAVEWGFVHIPAHTVFLDTVAPYPNAIVFSGEMDRAAMQTAPSFEVLLEVAGAYGRVGTIANRLSRYLWSLGYNAIPGHPLGGATDYPLLGQLAGLGEIGRNGMLISSSRGPSQRIGVVYTDIDALDFAVNLEDYAWVPQYCASCGLCVRACPVQAIYPERRPDASGQLASIDGDVCLPYFHSHFGCSKCLGVCPFTRTDYGRLKGAWQKRGSAKASRLPE